MSGQVELSGDLRWPPHGSTRVQIGADHVLGLLTSPRLYKVSSIVLTPRACAVRIPLLSPSAAGSCSVWSVRYGARLRATLCAKLSTVYCLSQTHTRLSTVASDEYPGTHPSRSSLPRIIASGSICFYFWQGGAAERLHCILD